MRLQFGIQNKMSYYYEDELYYDDFYQSHAPEAEYNCEQCGAPIFGEGYCYECADELGVHGKPGLCDDFEREYEGDIAFADPGGKSALRAATSNNPRNLPCPNCGRKNVLTPEDWQRGYQCDNCADELERGC